ncbi:DUF262 domain-containing protein [Pseudomonas sp. MAHUQ-62]|uniref:DUF262 domain-containing protein n=1 Tax=Pseudomonas sp. GCM10023245 TaxID=3252652 RepID=UPI0036107C2C
MNKAVNNEELGHISPLEFDSIAVATTTLDALFKAQRIPTSDGRDIFGRLHLPEYQRPYRWEVPQLVRLVEDLRIFFPDDSESNPPPPHDFYLGSITLHQHGGNTRQRGTLNIIDGQQRLTSLALLHFLLHGDKTAPDLRFSSPESQKRIRLNLAWLEQQTLPRVNFSRVNVSLVVTRSEDDAYRFFETQNTSGVRLGGGGYHQSVPSAQCSCSRPGRLR